MPDYRLLALDIDSTMLTDDKRITEETRIWIQRAVEAGVTVIFATGRGLQRVEHFREALQLNSPMVLLNGAEVWEGPDQLWKRHFIRPQDIVELHRLAIEKEVHFWGYSVEGLVGAKGWTDEMFERDWMKFGLRHRNADVVSELREYTKKWGTLEVVHSSPNSLEISLKGITKKTGVWDVCNFLGIGMEQVMAVGDSPNDLKLLQASGLSVAMGNAANEIKQMADHITDTNERDGVAKAIQRYLLCSQRQSKAQTSSNIEPV